MRRLALHCMVMFSNLKSGVLTCCLLMICICSWAWVARELHLRIKRPTAHRSSPGLLLLKMYNQYVSNTTWPPSLLLYLHKLQGLCILGIFKFLFHYLLHRMRTDGRLISMHRISSKLIIHFCWISHFLTRECSFTYYNIWRPQPNL